MAHVLLFGPCRLALVDQTTNQLSMIGIIEAMQPQEFPAQIPEFFLVSVLAADSSEIGLDMVQRLVITNDANQEIAAVEQPFTFERPRHRVIASVQGLRIESSGTYFCKLFIRESSGEYPADPFCTFEMLIGHLKAAT